MPGGSLLSLPCKRARRPYAFQEQGPIRVRHLSVLTNPHTPRGTRRRRKPRGLPPHLFLTAFRLILRLRIVLARSFFEIQVHLALSFETGTIFACSSARTGPHHTNGTINFMILRVCGSLYTANTMCFLALGAGSNGNHYCKSFRLRLWHGLLIISNRVISIYGTHP